MLICSFSFKIQSPKIRNEIYMSPVKFGDSSFGIEMKCEVESCCKFTPKSDAAVCFCFFFVALLLSHVVFLCHLFDGVFMVKLYFLFAYISLLKDFMLRLPQAFFLDAKKDTNTIYYGEFLSGVVSISKYSHYSLR